MNQEQICVYGIEQGDRATKWSEKFSLDAIKITGLTSCKVPNDRTYMVKRIELNNNFMKNHSDRFALILLLVHLV